MKKNRLNIAIIDMDDLKNPFWGSGQARATREVGKRLAEKHIVTVYSSKYPGYRDYTEDGIDYKHVGIINKNAQITNFMFILTIPFIVRKIKADIIIENFNAPASVSFAPLFTKIPVIGLPTMFNAIQFSKKYHLPFHWIEAIGMKFYKYMMPYSDIDSAKIKRLNHNVYYKIIPQGVGKEFFDIKHQSPKHILFLGRFDLAQKGIDLLLTSYSKVSHKIQYPLVIAGHGSDEQKISHIIKNLKLDEKVTIVGSAYGQKKIELISKAVFVAFPSRHDEQSLWSLEALASGLPLVAFDLPESKWMIEKVALKAKPFDVEEYAKLLLQMTDKTLNDKMRSNARQLAQHYTWDHTVSRFESFFQDVLEKEHIN